MKKELHLGKWDSEREVIASLHLWLWELGNPTAATRLTFPGSDTSAAHCQDELSEQL